MYNSPRLIAEIGCNHMGSLDIAMKLVDAAADCGVYAVKFQKRSPHELLTHEQYYALHPNPYHSFGKTYGEHREFLELSIAQHRELKAYCESKEMIYSSSVWDLTSAKEIAALSPCFVKVPSACNSNLSIITWLCENYQGELHISLGMIKREDIHSLIANLVRLNRAKDTVIYACTSGYPVSTSDICLLQISELILQYKNAVKDIAFSGHHLGIVHDISAYTLGTSTIERHFTLDKLQKGTDHSASLIPSEMRQLKDNLDAVYIALKHKPEELLPVEQEQFMKFNTVK